MAFPISSETILPLIKQSARVSATNFDSLQLDHLIKSAQLDLGIAGVEIPSTYDELVAQAVTTYCLMNFGIVEEYDKLKKSYDEQKAQLVTATGYTNWGDA